MASPRHPTYCGSSRMGPAPPERARGADRRLAQPRRRRCGSLEVRSLLLSLLGGKLGVAWRVACLPPVARAQG
eukprot:11592870-Alexandrium_andersonii.AAC.1